MAMLREKQGRGPKGAAKPRSPVAQLLRPRSSGSHTSPPQPPLTTAHLIFVMLRLVATTRMGAMSDSSARFRKEKHSMSSMCTCGTVGGGTMGAYRFVGCIGHLGKEGHSMSSMV